MSGTFFAWVNERTNTPFKSLFFALSLDPPGHSGHSLHRVVDIAGEPEDRHHQLRAAGIVRHRCRLRRHLFPGRHDLRRRHASIAARVPADDGGFPRDGPLARGIRPDERRDGAADRPARDACRLAWPAALAAFLILFVRAVESFEVPALLGLPVGIEVYTSSIYQAIQRYPSEVGLASAYAVTLLLIASLCIYAQSRVAGEVGKFSTVTGKGLPAAPDATSADGAISPRRSSSLISPIIVALPFLVLVWCSLQKFYSAPSLSAMTNLTFRRLSRRVRLSGHRRRDLEHRGARGGERHHHHADDVGARLDRRSNQAARARGCSTPSRRCRWCFRASCSVSPS